MRKQARRCAAAVTAISLVWVTLLFAAPTTTRGQPSEVVPLWGPYLTGVSETGITVNWKTEGETVGSVEYAPEASYSANSTYSSSIPDSAKTLHHVALTGLQPNTTYHYRVRVDEGCAADHTFTTLGAERFTFVVYGDTRDEAPMFTQLERHKLVADRIAEEEGVSFVIHTGDLVSDGNDLEEWGRFFEAGRRMLDHVPIFPVAGNHEDYSANYYEIFSVPQWYSFDSANAHFSMLDSNDGADLDVEAAWLANDLSGDADWKFAVCHHPLYTSDPNHWGGDPSLRDHWEQVLMENGVAAVFNAHMHAYERYWENGIHHVVLGIGGAPSYKLADQKIDGYRNSLEHSLGYARITIDGDDASMEVIRVADLSVDNGEVVDVYPPGTVFETVSLSPESPDGEGPTGSLAARANVTPNSVGLALDRDSIDFGDVVPGQDSAVETVRVTNTGSTNIDVSLELAGENATGQSFYEQSLNVNADPYGLGDIVASIPTGGTRSVDTQLEVPALWNGTGEQRATFTFWAAEAKAAQDGSGFSISPAELEVTVPEGGSGVASAYITSYFTGDLVVGTEGIPYRVDPESIPVNSTDRGRKVELSLQENSSAKAGQYQGKLTFLADAGGSVAYGVKVDITVRQLGGQESPAFIDRLTGWGWVTVAVLVGTALAALLLGVLIGRRLKRT
jgi:predicted phosphodiesterase